MFNDKSGLSKFADSLEANQKDKHSFNSMLSELSKEYSGVISGSSKSLNEKYASEYNDYDFIRESN